MRQHQTELHCFTADQNGVVIFS